MWTNEKLLNLLQNYFCLLNHAILTMHMIFFNFEDI